MHLTIRKSSEYVDHPLWSTACIGSTLKFCNLCAFDSENSMVSEKLLCFKKLAPNLFELRIVKASGEVGTKCSVENALLAIDDLMSKVGTCTYVEWIPRSNISSLIEV